MKRLTLDQTWIECMRLWKHIARKVRAAIKAGEKWNVDDLKREWCIKHGCEGLNLSCFFCEYDDERQNRLGSRDCSFCPAKKIDKGFYCSEGELSCFDNPLDFYAELRRLHKLYKKGLKSK